MEIYWYLVKYKGRNNGNSPSHRMIMKACEVSSTSMVVFYLDKLQEGGLIEHDGVRGIRIVGSSWSYKRPDKLDYLEPGQLKMKL